MLPLRMNPVTKRGKVGGREVIVLIGKGGSSRPLPPAQCIAVMWDASLSCGMLLCSFPTDFRYLEFFKAECVDLKTFGWNESNA